VPVPILRACAKRCLEPSNQRKRPGNQARSRVPDTFSHTANLRLEHQARHAPLDARRHVGFPSGRPSRLRGLGTTPMRTWPHRGLLRSARPEVAVRQSGVREGDRQEEGSTSPPGTGRVEEAAGESPKRPGPSGSGSHVSPAVTLFASPADGSLVNPRCRAPSPPLVRGHGDTCVAAAAAGEALNPRSSSCRAQYAGFGT
jgi:hypothetical protein